MSATNGGLRSRRTILPAVDAGTNAPKRTTEQTQSTSTQTPAGPKPYVHPVGFTTNVENGAAFGVPSATARALRQNENRLAVSADSATTTIVPTPVTANIPIVSPPPTAPTNIVSTPIATTKDDNPNNPPNSIQQEILINTGTQPGLPIQPRPNVLDQFASYTYNLAWYGLTPEQYSAVVSTSRINVNSWSLLVQSGGAAQQQQGVSNQGVNSGQDTPINGPLTNIVTPNRNKYFTLDYFLDDLTIETSVTGVSASQFTKISFKVSEPNGITLIPNLNFAGREFNSSPLNADYCMVVKFYGWDINGNLITDPTRTTGTPGATPSISNAILTRYYPFTIIDVTFKIDGKNIIYEVTGQPKNYAKAASTSLGSIPANFELSGETVSQVLSASQNSVTSALNSLISAASGGRETTNSSSPPTSQTGESTKADSMSFDISNNIM
jgi:hypothetical protein